MGFLRTFWRSLKDPNLRLAWAIAIAADALQIVLLPMFAAGAVSPVTDAVDVVVAIALIQLLGWHWAFLPTFVVELLPGIDLLPTWTAALLFVSRSYVRSREPEILPPVAPPPTHN